MGQREWVYTMWIDPVRQQNLERVLCAVDVDYTRKMLEENPNNREPHRVRKWEYTMTLDEKQHERVEICLRVGCVNVISRQEAGVSDGTA